MKKYSDALESYMIPATESMTASQIAVGIIATLSIGMGVNGLVKNHKLFKSRQEYLNSLNLENSKDAIKDYGNKMVDEIIEVAITTLKKCFNDKKFVKALQLEAKTILDKSPIKNSDITYNVEDLQFKITFDTEYGGHRIYIIDHECELYKKMPFKNIGEFSWKLLGETIENLVKTLKETYANEIKYKFVTIELSSEEDDADAGIYIV